MAESTSQQRQPSGGNMLTPDAIASLLSSAPASARADPPSQEQQQDRTHKTTLLVDVLYTAQKLWDAGSEDIDAVAEKLGDGSRDASWRLPLGDSGVLDFFLSVIVSSSHNLRPALQRHMLRLVGNSCADTDENRERVVASKALPVIISFLADDAALPFAVPVLYNVLVDYEPAQAQASASSLTTHLVDLLTSTRLADAPHLVGIIAKILALLATHETEATLAPPQTPAVLLTLALTPTTDAEDFVALAAVALAYLTHEPVQAALVAAGAVPVLLAAFYHLQTQLDAIEVDDDDAAAQLRALPQSFVQVLADISYADAFAARHPLGDPVLDTLQSWLSLPNPHLRAAACLCLGNVARSDEASFALVRDRNVHLPLVGLLRDATDSLLLHSALSFLKNLAIPSQNKPVLGDAGLLDPDVLPRVWSLDANPQVQFAAISLTRLLLINTPANVRRLCAPLSPDPLSPAHGTTHLHRLLDIFSRTDAEHTRTEAARAAAAVCRVLHTATIPPKPLSPAAFAEAAAEGDDCSGGSGAPHRRREKFYRQHAGLSRALAFLVTQTRFPVLRSEAWFVFALMCRSRDGAEVVIRALEVAGAFEALTQAITGRAAPSGEGGDGDDAQAGVDAKAIEGAPARADAAAQAVVSGGGSASSVVEGLGLEPQQADPSQAAGMKKVDRENGLVMVSELVKSHADELPASRRAAFEDMLKEGGEMLVGEKGKGKV
ncbi:GTP binding protein [Colletotrichum zoysiae]|uniref:GTP binding protein n=1 Tax=Colletotrichum zoysiae TaxID=1216348 RepID=A0AAD9H5V8_9PEZI|nr:GTP binding protein [Colletotrichum zoysiae]